MTRVPIDFAAVPEGNPQGSTLGVIPSGAPPATPWPSAIMPGNQERLAFLTEGGVGLRAIVWQIGGRFGSVTVPFTKPAALPPAPPLPQPGGCRQP